MRKIKSMLCAVFMSVVLAGNVFAVDSYTTVFTRANFSYLKHSNIIAK
jgi:hypothetical protein